MAVLDTKYEKIRSLINGMVAPSSWSVFYKDFCAAYGIPDPSVLWGDLNGSGLRAFIREITGADPGENAEGLEERVSEGSLLEELALGAAAFGDRIHGRPYLESFDRQHRRYTAYEEDVPLLWTAQDSYELSVPPIGPVVGEYNVGGTTVFYRESTGKYGTVEWEYSLDSTFSPEDRARAQAIVNAAESSPEEPQPAPAKGTVLRRARKVASRKPTLWVRRVADGQGGSELEYSGDENFSDVGILFAQGITAIRSKKQEREKVKRSVTMGDSYAESDVRANQLVLYFPADTAEARRVTRVQAKERPPKRVFRQGAEKVPVGKYGWVMTLDNQLYLFDCDLQLKFEIVTRGGEVVSHTIPETLTGITGAGMDKFGNIGSLLKFLKDNQVGAEVPHVTSVVLRHSSHTGGGPVLGAGICRVDTVTVPATRDGKALYLNKNEPEAPYTVESDPPQKFGPEWEQVYSTDHVLTDCDNDSGHYRPLVENLQNAVQELVRQKFMRRSSQVKFIATDRSEGETTYRDEQPLAGMVADTVDHAGGPVPYAELSTRNAVAREAAKKGFLHTGMAAEIQLARIFYHRANELTEHEARKQFLPLYERCIELYGASPAIYMRALEAAESIDLDAFKEAWAAKMRSKGMAMSTILTDRECQMLPGAKVSLRGNRLPNAGPQYSDNEDDEELRVMNKRPLTSRVHRMGPSPSVTPEVSDADETDVEDNDIVVANEEVEESASPADPPTDEGEGHAYS
ncbi:hypothetical protein [Streptacidiphilus rugosus]|uniref:hypothetical protein n=1 Tax=Streptacidiphilus rugosus TaxID=405783 RepID=UPI00056C3A17|nr:hypothetical protein [Streptacidiphilus rugosus]